jgi:Spy/CpxP family protein refolding chaperone
MIRSAFLACLSLGAANVSAQTVTVHGSGPGMGLTTSMAAPIDQIDFVSGYLNLSTAQTEQAKPLFKSERDATTALFDSMKQAQEALTAAEKSNQPDSEIERLAAAVGAVHGQLAAIHSKTFMRFRALLSADQISKLDKLSSPMAGAIGMGFLTTSGPTHPQ